MSSNRHQAAARPITFSRAGFSLVELIVVIGIIVILIALLLPALDIVRAQSNGLVCQVTLRTIGQAALLHAIQHQGYLPIAGWHWQPKGGQVNPQGLNDEAGSHYIYYEDNDERRPVPVTVALANALGVAVRIDNRENMEADMETDSFRKYFRCPMQGRVLLGLSEKEDGPGWESPREASSYIFNEAVLGLRERAEWRSVTPMGKLSLIARPSVVMLAMDGRPRNQSRDDWLLVFDKGPNWSMDDFNQFVQAPNVGWGKESIDYARHRYRANVLFVDGHVDSVPLDRAGLKTIGVNAGIDN
jgi:prepilin-type processing-associated H-X9-DG protein/prepilin-type N-terminal cleavage/methylation domain-containing protein